MAVGDILRDIGEGVKTGARAVGAVAQPLGKAVAEEEAGYAPQIAEEKRKHQEQMEDAQINAKAQELEGQLTMGQKYGTLTPAQQQQYVDQISQLYSHPRHAGTLMEKLRKAIHPNGAYASGPQAALPNATPQGGTNVADLLARNKANLDYGKEAAEQTEEQKHQALKADIDFMRQNIKTFMPNATPEQQQQFLNEYIERKTGVLTGRPQGMKLNATGGIVTSVSDPETGRQWSASDLGPTGNAPPEAKQLYADYEKGVDQKKKDADAKWQKEQDEINRRQQISLQNQSDRLISMFQNMLSMDQFKDAEKQIAAHETTYNGAVDLQKKMQGLLPQALSGNQQAQVAILADHIAMTTHQPGASMRPTKALFDEAASSQPTLEKYRKYFDPDVPGGFKSGLVLSPQEARQMVDMAQTTVDAERDTLQEMKQGYQQQLNPSPSAPRGKHTSAKPVNPGSILPKTGAKPIVQHSPSTGAYRYSMDGGKTWQAGKPPAQ